MRLGISTTFQPTKTIKRLLEGNLIDFVELGFGSEKASREMVGDLPRSAIRALHGIPFQDEDTSDFMFNPCYRPLKASEVLGEMVEKASRIGLEYEFYGVHAGLLGEIVGPDDFTVTDNIGAKEGIDNLATFRRNIPQSGKIIMDGIYGWDPSSRAIGMTQEELESMGELLPLLVDISHVAINFERYGDLSLDSLCVGELPIAEVHLSFLDFTTQPPWDHRGFSPTAINLRIMSKLKEILEVFPKVPVVLEIVGDENTIEDALVVVNKDAG